MEMTILTRNDYKRCIPRRYVLLTDLGSILDGIVGLSTFGMFSSRFALNAVKFGAKKQMEKQI